MDITSIMKDNKYIHFLQWALPRLNLRWRGLRKVRRQVCKRIHNRITELGIGSLSSYKKYLEENPDEWTILDSFCRITISRFYRDRIVYDYLFADVLPALVDMCTLNNNRIIRVWSAGCASGEEPYTLSIGWQHTIQPVYPEMKVHIIATDIDPVMLTRADEACYPPSSLRSLPVKWKDEAFKKKVDSFILLQPYKNAVRFELLDIREKAPKGVFQVIFCRNLAFTYFDQELRQAVLQRIGKKLATGGILITGGHEEVPIAGTDFVPWVEHMPIFQKK